MFKIFIPIILAIFLSACFDTRQSSSKSLQGKKMDFLINKVDNGYNIKLKDNNKMLILNFFATDCGACKEEIPSFVELTKDLSSKVEVIGVLGNSGTKEQREAFLNKYKINYQVVAKKQTVDMLSSAVGGVMGVPVTYIFKPNGKRVEKFLGYVPHNTLLKALKNHISL